MSLATEPPARLDLSLFTDDDRIVGAKWFASDGVTPVTITAATLTLLFDQLPLLYDEDGMPVPQVDPIQVTINSTTENPDGWVDLTTAGVVLVTLPASMWSSLELVTSSGIWDLVAVGPTQRCLFRGEFNVEIGVMA